jgi:hypothetical protein
MFIQPSPPTARIPRDIKLELLGLQEDLLTQLKQIVLAVGTPEEEASAWLAERMAGHAAGEILIISARIGRLLVGFLIVEPATLTASYSWVLERFRNKGLGQRFYSFACINLGAPAPRFVFPAAMRAEYQSVLKALEIQPEVGAQFWTANGYTAQAA